MFGELFLINQTSKCPVFIFLSKKEAPLLSRYETTGLSGSGLYFLGCVNCEYEYSEIEEFVCDQFHLANGCRINISFLRTCMFGYCGQD